MKSDHGRFDALAGALALGEATAAEREQFETHALMCPTCREHGVEELVGVREFITAAREEETWRPSLGSPLMARIRDGRLRRSRLALRALGWSVALSLVLDAAFISGITSYAGHVIHAGSNSMANIATSYRTALR
ncbi:MAG: zf-HC2 domain-containing protein [Candidatus Eremiobacteraeota bacterium]|nr:zf-HC2 domain-containing protein [Candidatus Eremiobacteraeota bacterium]